MKINLTIAFPVLLLVKVNDKLLLDPSFCLPTGDLYIGGVAKETYKSRWKPVHAKEGFQGCLASKLI